MAFLNRLFNRKGKAEFATSPQPSLRRSLTDPTPPSTMSPPRGRRSSSDEKDTVDSLPGSRLATARPRRAGCDFSRSKTSTDIGSVRSSTSSAAEPAGNSVDGAKTQYRQMKALHRSRLHTIMAAQDQSNKHSVVMKTFYKGRLTTILRAKMESEAHHLRLLAGVPGVVKFLNQYEDDDSFYIVLERCTGVSLIELAANRGGRLAEQAFVPAVLLPLTQVLVDLHRHGIVHRQIKPEHVLCRAEEGAVTLVDFAEAVNKNQRCLNNRAGSLEYMAPEVLNKPTAEEVFHQVLYNGMSEEELPQYDEKADVWSLGVLAFEALTGCQPFLADNPAEMGRLQREMLTEVDASGTQRIFWGRPELSAEARSFLLQALQLDPINRSSAERLLQHPLMQLYWAKYQATQVTLLGAASRVVPLGGPAVAAATRPAGAACGTVPMVGQKASLLATAPLQFPVR